MIIVAQTDSLDASYNLAFEQYLLDTINTDAECFMLWRNTPCIIMGKYQNAFEELNHTFIRLNKIPVYRRISGGGTVYHDMGNINFSFISKRMKMAQVDLSIFSKRISNALNDLGFPSTVNARNDILLDGLKFSGNAQCIRKGRLLHHGTLLYEADLTELRQALKHAKDEVTSRAVKSVTSSVTNIKDGLTEKLAIGTFIEKFKTAMCLGRTVETFTPSADALETIKQLQHSNYQSWAWNYAASPPCTIEKKRSVLGSDPILIKLNIKSGCIEQLSLSTKRIYNKSTANLINACMGQDFRYKPIYAIIKKLYPNCSDAELDALTCAITE